MTRWNHEITPGYALLPACGHGDAPSWFPNDYWPTSARWKRCVPRRFPWRQQMKIHRNALAAIFVIVILVMSALAADPGGKWKTEFDTQVGVQKYTFVFKVDGEKLTGKASF